MDEHFHPAASWGVRPVLFHLGSLAVPSYGAFIIIAIAAAAIVIVRRSKSAGSYNEETFLIVLAALLGGILGAKIPIWLINARSLVEDFSIGALLSGRTIVGGLVGGTVSVVLFKRVRGTKTRKGNIFAPAVALAIAIGRGGCFLRGCCFGLPSHLPWAVNFGDGVPRHPTQAYEALFMLLVFFYLRSKEPAALKPGVLMDRFMLLYFGYRFLSEFMRAEPTLLWGLTMFQLVSLLVLLYYWQKSRFYARDASPKCDTSSIA